MNTESLPLSFRKFWTPEELAQHLQVKKRWVYEHAREDAPDRIPHIKLGKYLRFNPNSEKFQAWLKRREITPAEVDNGIGRK